ncbi:hypothetical protein [Pseudonocardia sp. HH130630-07]|uniref:hypothetical protein n=1 Tax=Pseudonocardia sp. HH130630-07 TaxID=1690815 RepID=UPI000814FA45|nr:hypothetical protein [Pseudonocardia sp. HH130630-07]ANY06254.1 hypothetical protein AFB00_08030 [Pseudonocardia sp. HH130630-07]
MIRRIPVVGGLAGGIGTTSVSRALYARDLGVVSGSGVLPDVLLCRDTVSGLATAARIAPGPGAGPGGPVLAIHPRSAEPDGVDADAAGTGWAAVVALPWVPGWSRSADPWADAAAVLGQKTPSAAVRRYAEALGRIVDALVAGGRLDRSLVPRHRGQLRPVRGVVLRTGSGR